MRVLVSGDETWFRRLRDTKIGRGWLVAGCFAVAVLSYALGVAAISFLADHVVLAPEILVTVGFVVVFLVPSALTWLGIAVGVAALDTAPSIRVLPTIIAYGGAGIVAANVAFLGLPRSPLTLLFGFQILLILLFWPSYLLAILVGVPVDVGVTFP